MCAADHPDLRIHLLEVEPRQAMGRLTAGDLDPAVSQDWANVPDRLRGEGIGHDPAVRAIHPLAKREAVALTDPAAEPRIVSTAGTIRHDWLTGTFRRDGHEPADRPPGSGVPDAACTRGRRAGRGPDPPAGPPTAYRPASAPSRSPRPLERRVFAVWRAESGGRPAIRAVLAALRAKWPTAR